MSNRRTLYMCIFSIEYILNAKENEHKLLENTIHWIDFSVFTIYFKIYAEQIWISIFFFLLQFSVCFHSYSKSRHIRQWPIVIHCTWTICFMLIRHNFWFKRIKTLLRIKFIVYKCCFDRKIFSAFSLRDVCHAIFKHTHQKKERQRIISHRNTFDSHEFKKFLCIFFTSSVTFKLNMCRENENENSKWKTFSFFFFGKWNWNVYKQC